MANEAIIACKGTSNTATSRSEQVATTVSNIALSSDGSIQLNMNELPLYGMRGEKQCNRAEQVATVPDTVVFGPFDRHYLLCWYWNFDSFYFIPSYLLLSDEECRGHSILNCSEYLKGMLK